MSRRAVLALYYLATFLQAGAYGLTFLMPPLFAGFGGDEQDVGRILGLTTVATLAVVLASGHVTDRLGRMPTIGLAGLAIAAALGLMGTVDGVGPALAAAGVLLGLGWGLFYTLGPVVLTTLIAPEERVRQFTLLSVFIMAGFGLSPVMGSVLEGAGFGIAAAFKVSAGLCALSALIFFALTRPIARLAAASGSATAGAPRAELSAAAIGRVLRSRALAPIVMVGLGASVFAGVTNFQTVYAEASGLDYAHYFLAYTVTVIVCRVLFAEFIGGRAPYGVIALLLAVMTGSVALFLTLGDSGVLYVLGAVLFGIGYGVSYPIVKAMAANDAEADLIPQTLQLFGLSYFVGVFGFPYVAGWTITQHGMATLLVGVGLLAAIECTIAARRYLGDRAAAPGGAQPGEAGR